METTDPTREQPHPTAPPRRPQAFSPPHIPRRPFNNRTPRKAVRPPPPARGTQPPRARRRQRPTKPPPSRPRQLLSSSQGVSWPQDRATRIDVFRDRRQCPFVAQQIGQPVTRRHSSTPAVQHRPWNSPFPASRRPGGGIKPSLKQVPGTQAVRTGAVRIFGDGISGDRHGKTFGELARPGRHPRQPQGTRRPSAAQDRFREGLPVSTRPGRRRPWPNRPAPRRANAVRRLLRSSCLRHAGEETPPAIRPQTEPTFKMMRAQARSSPALRLQQHHAPGCRLRPPFVVLNCRITRGTEPQRINTETQ